MDPSIQPVIHAPTKCPIHLKNELKSDQEQMVKDRVVITKVDEPTEWVNSLAYSRKSSGQLLICLDTKELNKCYEGYTLIHEIMYN